MIESHLLTPVVLATLLAIAGQSIRAQELSSFQTLRVSGANTYVSRVHELIQELEASSSAPDFQPAPLERLIAGQTKELVDLVLTDAIQESSNEKKFRLEEAKLIACLNGNPKCVEVFDDEINKLAEAQIQVGLAAKLVGAAAGQPPAAAAASAASGKQLWGRLRPKLGLVALAHKVRSAEQQ